MGEGGGVGWLSARSDFNVGKLSKYNIGEQDSGKVCVTAITCCYDNTVLDFIKCYSLWALTTDARF